MWKQVMKYNSKKYHRRSIRLKGYDYSQPGAYFITICTRDRSPVLAHIIDGEIHLSEIGKIVKEQWHNLKNRFPNVEIDEFVVMPNHIHGIIVITDADGNDGIGGTNIVVKIRGEL